MTNISQDYSVFTVPWTRINEISVTAPATSAQEAPTFLPPDTFTSSNFADIMMAQNILDNQPFELNSTIFDTPSQTAEPMPPVLATILQKL